MATQLLGSMLAFVLAVMPLVVLAGLALVGDMIGEWGRTALLAYAAVLLGFLAGIGAAGPGAGTAHLAGGGAAVTVAVVALFLGGSTGLVVLAAGYGIVMGVVLFKPGTALPWPLLAFAGAACLLVAMRYRFN